LRRIISVRAAFLAVILAAGVALAIRAAHGSISGGVAASGSSFRGSACDTVSSFAGTRVEDLVFDLRNRHA
jgi:hypothetical protein